ncbi:uncharacterized protein EI90DRAFT_3054634 [Cantharellus anzutake]|uniref:uncharacterized protein n=1 Tax=Cantharellus anzutake TaxID=1750568 RepID=UPI001907E022|nr:uncharacterized protein EI90DRAFT_3054634 [Cantharellus anzutake]KAF8332852.1 hypothetical protein EI90DRAFT_3054634 [Cantharellus anzutake]
MPLSSNPTPPGPSPTARAGTSEGHESGLRSFRIVGRILFNDELEKSGLRYPQIPNRGASPSRMDVDSRHPSPPSPPKKRKQREAGSFTAVLAICHDSHSGRGIEFIPEGLDCLGLCGSAPKRVDGAVTPYGLDRECSQVGLLGKEILEITWAGCLALLDG